MKLLSIILLIAFTVPIFGQSLPAPPEPSGITAAVAPQDVEFKEARTGFHRALLKATRQNVKNAAPGADKIKAIATSWKIRRAMLLPGMRAEVKQLVEMQIRLEVAAGNTTDAIPVVGGVVDTASIDWDALAAFIERMIPIILMLIEIFGGL